MRAEATALAGVARWRLHRHVDMRGDLHELQRDSWPGAPPVAQWNLVRTRANVLRGVALHLVNADYYLLVAGRAWLGLADLRPESPTFRRTDTIALDGEAMAGIVVPPGVAHGIWHETDCVGLGALSRRFDPDDKFGARWDDPALGIAWPCRDPQLLERDRAWPAADALFERVRRHRERVAEHA
jgi:dTDP-4-dehydrorhamnose 3,5-epimerase